MNSHIIDLDSIPMSNKVAADVFFGNAVKATVHANTEYTVEEN